LAETCLYRVRFPSSHDCVVYNLVWHFFKDLFSEDSFSYRFVEGNELDDITFGNFSSISQKTTVGVKFFHFREIGISDTDDND
jgi:hypothetical protein